VDLLVNMRDFLRSFKHRGPSKIYCPKCASSNIHLSSKLDYWLTPVKYVCRDCGYTGPIFMELEKEESEKKAF
jgi:predicted RNA-binding Zn-ribbon protein involved in translation (DUF1610 family)